MTIRTALAGCALAFATLAAGTAAYAGDPYGGFGPSETGTQEIGSDPDQGGPTPDAYQTLPWLQQQSQSQQDSHGGEWDQQGAASDEYDMDDEGGH
jgi:hypothetical protein